MDTFIPSRAPIPTRAERTIGTLVVLLVAMTGSALLTASPAHAVTVGAPTLVAVDAGAPTLSGTGRYVAYTVTTFDTSGVARTRLVRKDRTTGTTQILNRNTSGGVAGGIYSQPPIISDDGRRVAFSSNSARLVAGDTNGRFDAFVRLPDTSQTLLGSPASGGGPSNGDVGMVSMSASGRFLAYTSSGTDVVPGSTTTNADVYRRDLSTGTTIQVTVRPNGTPSVGPGANSVGVSANGNIVAFTSYNTDLAGGEGQENEPDLFVRNVSAGTTRWLSSAFPVGAEPFAVVLSPDGRWVSTRWADGSLHLTEVATAATRLVAADGYAQAGAFDSSGNRFVYTASGQAQLLDLSTGSVTGLRTPSGGVATTVGISADGRFAAYGWNDLTGQNSRVYLVSLT